MTRKSTPIYYAVLSAILFLIELAIALWAHGFLRYYVGDILIIPLIYCILRVFTERWQRLLPFLVCCLGFLAEFLQYFHFVDLLGLDHDSPLAIAIGTGFSWVDVICYLIGMVMIYAGMFLRKTLNSQKSRKEGALS